MDDDGEGRKGEGDENAAEEKKAIPDANTDKVRLEKQIAAAKIAVEKARELKTKLGVPDAGLEGDNEMHKYINNAFRESEEYLQKLEAMNPEQQK